MKREPPAAGARIIFATLILACNVMANAQDYDDEIEAFVTDLAVGFQNHESMGGFLYVVDEEEAYRWQDVFVSEMAKEFGEVAGYKTGGHRPGKPSPTFPLHGIRGTLLEGMISPSGTSVGLDDTVRGFLEADFAFRVGSNSVNNAVTDLEILAGLDAIVPFIEIPDPDYERDGRSPTGSIVSNMATRVAFVGEPVPIEASAAWIKKINNFNFAVHDENGTEIASGNMGDWYKPLDVVRWLRDQLVNTGHTLKPGQILSLGNIGILRQIKDNPSDERPAYQSDEFILSYYGLSEKGPATVSVRVRR